VSGFFMGNSCVMQERMLSCIVNSVRQNKNIPSQVRLWDVMISIVVW